MPHTIGPYPRSRIVLCSADAGPGAQREQPAPAVNFYPHAVWVKALFNVALKLGCRSVILTTGHGMVNPYDVIEPYDFPIRRKTVYVSHGWADTVPRLLGGNCCDVLLFYAGGCPRDAYIDVMRPIVRRLMVDLISFGRPNMYDFPRISQVVELLVNGTTEDDIKSLLDLPDQLRFFSATE